AVAPRRKAPGKPPRVSGGTPSAAIPSAVTPTFSIDEGLSGHGAAVVICGLPGVPSTSDPRKRRAAAPSATRSTKCLALSTRYPRRMVPWMSARSSWVTGGSGAAARRKDLLHRVGVAHVELEQA